MATSTIHTYLEYKPAGETSTWTILCPIKNYPDLSESPERIDVTTLSDEMRHYVPGVRDLPDYDFLANYEKDRYQAIVALRNQELDLRVRFGETTDIEVSNFTFRGKIDATINGGEVNSAREMTVNVYPSVDVELAT